MISTELGIALIENDLDGYIDILEKNGIDTIEVISELNENDLEKIGISLMGDRKKILKLFGENGLAKTVDNSAILKQDKFKAWIRKSWGLSENGTLTLYSDRLDWNNAKEIIYIKDIIDVNTTEVGGTGQLIIKDKNNDKFTFSTGMGTAIALQLALGAAAMLAPNKTGIDAWRQMIEKLRGNN